MHLSTKVLGIILPVAALFVMAGLLFVAGIPAIGPTPDLIVTAIELAVTTLYALAIGGSTAFVMRHTAQNLDNTYRCELIKLAAAGDKGALSVLRDEAIAWFLWAALWSCVYLRWL